MLHGIKSLFTISSITVLKLGTIFFSVRGSSLDSVFVILQRERTLHTSTAEYCVVLLGSGITELPHGNVRVLIFSRGGRSLECVEISYEFTECSRAMAYLVHSFGTRVGISLTTDFYTSWRDSAAEIRDFLWRLVGCSDCRMEIAESQIDAIPSWTVRPFVCKSTVIHALDFILFVGMVRIKYKVTIVTI